MVNYNINKNQTLGRNDYMKIDWNRKYTTVAAYSLITIVLGVLFVVFVFKFDEIRESVSWIWGVVAPIICGLIIAYILNPLMMFLENKVFRKIKDVPPPEENIVMKKIHESSVGNNIIVKELEKRSASMEKKIHRRKTMVRILSLVLTFLILLGVIVAIIYAVVPALTKSISDLVNQMPGYVKQIEEWATKVFENNPQIAEIIAGEIMTFQDFLNKIAEQLRSFAGDIVGGASKDVMTFVVKLFTSVKNVVMGFIIAIYLLYSKEKLLAQCKKIFYAIMKPQHCEAFFSGCAKSNDIFKKYIISNILDSVIIFIFMAIGMFAMNMPYQMLIAVVCAVTNLIPFFGPFIGAIPCGLLILLVDPIKVLWFAIFVLVVQQIDGNVIKPFMFGETMGLPAIWVLLSIIVGGGLFGIPGMLLGAPVFAVFYFLFANFIKDKLKKKNLPGETDLYTDNYQDFQNKYVGKTASASEDTSSASAYSSSSKPAAPTVQKTRTSVFGNRSDNKKK